MRYDAFKLLKNIYLNTENNYYLVIANHLYSYCDTHIYFNTVNCSALVKAVKNCLKNDDYSYIIEFFLLYMGTLYFCCILSKFK